MQNIVIRYNSTIAIPYSTYPHRAHYYLTTAGAVGKFSDNPTGIAGYKFKNAFNRGKSHGMCIALSVWGMVLLYGKAIEVLQNH